MARKVSKVALKNSSEAGKPAAGERVPAWIVLSAASAAYLAALIYARATVPLGMNNDVAEEALRGLYLVFGRHFEVITFVLGNSAETLYLYLVGVSAITLGTNLLAIQIVSWIFAIATLWLVAKLASRADSRLPEWIPFLAAASSLWLFHYARSGLRAISSPFFLALFALTLDGAEREPEESRPALLAGAILGLSLYAYTSDRALAIAFAAYSIWRLLRAADLRRALLRCYGFVVVAAAIVSIPNLWLFVQRPADFLNRGGYVFRGGLSERFAGMASSALLPFYLPERYQTLASPAFQSDGVAAGFSGAGFHALPIIFAAALLYGLWSIRKAASTIVTFLLFVWVTVVLSVGLAGPSVTRLLILSPVFLVFTALGFGAAARLRPNLGLTVAAVVIAATGVVSMASYFSASDALSRFYAGNATAIGETASELAARGDRVLCVISGEASVVRYLTYQQSARVKIAEFYQRDVNLAEIPFDEFRGGTLLLEKSPQFAAFASRFPAQWVTHAEGYDLVRLPAQ